MLSRAAESLFWVGRYVERAEDTARLLDVHLQLLVERASPAEDSAGVEAAACRELLTLMGIDPGGRSDRSRVLELLAYAPYSPPSIVASLGAARAIARQVRGDVPDEVWEVLEAVHGSVPSGRWRAASPHAFLTWVRDRTAAVAGLADGAMTRDDGWLFLVAGRSIERADMTARLVASTLLATSSQEASAWPSLLRACGARPTSGRAGSAGRGGSAGPDVEAAHLLLLDRAFPRSIVHALSLAERCLGDLEASQALASGVPDEAQRRLARARSELEYRPLADVLAHLGEEMERVQRTCTAACDAIGRRYFAAEPHPSSAHPSSAGQPWAGPSWAAQTWVGRTA